MESNIKNVSNIAVLLNVYFDQKLTEEILELKESMHKLSPYNLGGGSGDDIKIKIVEDDMNKNVEQSNDSNLNGLLNMDNTTHDYIDDDIDLHSTDNKNVEINHVKSNEETNFYTFADVENLNKKNSNSSDMKNSNSSDMKNEEKLNLSDFIGLFDLDIVQRSDLFKKKYNNFHTSQEKIELDNYTINCLDKCIHQTSQIFADGIGFYERKRIKGINEKQGTKRKLENFDVKEAINNDDKISKNFKKKLLSVYTKINNVLSAIKTVFYKKEDSYIGLRRLTFLNIQLKLIYLCDALKFDKNIYSDGGDSVYQEKIYNKMKVDPKNKYEENNNMSVVFGDMIDQILANEESTLTKDIASIFSVFLLYKEISMSKKKQYKYFNLHKLMDTFDNIFVENIKDLINNDKYNLEKQNLVSFVKKTFVDTKMEGRKTNGSHSPTNSISDYSESDCEYGVEY